MERNKTCNILGVIVFVLALAAGTPALAQLAVIPQRANIAVIAGQTVTRNLAVSNRGRQPSTIYIRAYNMALSPKGLPGRASEDAPRGCTDWISVKPEEVTLDGGETASIQCTLSPPRDAAGGYYALIEYTTRRDVPAEGREGEQIRGSIDVGMSVATVLLVTVRGGRLQVGAEIAEVGLGLLSDEERIASGRQWQTKALIKNPGNMHAIMEGTASILTEDGRTQLETVAISAGLGYVLAEGVRLFSGAGQYNLPDGGYLLLIRVGPIHRSQATWARHLMPFFVDDGKIHGDKPTEAMSRTAQLLAVRVMAKPPTLQFDAPPGGMRTQAAELINPSDEPLTIACEVADWIITPDHGAIKVGEGLQGERSRPELVSAPRRITVPPRGHTTVPLSVQIPRDAAGEYYPAVVYRAVIAGRKQPQEAQYLPSTTLVCTVTGTEEPNLEMGECSVERQADGAIVFDMTLHNTGNVRLSTNSQVSITDERGNPAVEALAYKPNNMPLLAGGSRYLSLKWYGNLELGDYKANFYSTSEKGVSAGTSVKFEVKPLTTPPPPEKPTAKEQSQQPAE